MNEPTPRQAAAALRAVHEARERVITAAAGPRWLWTARGLLIFAYSVANDLFPAARIWPWAIGALVLALALGLRTRMGSALLGRPVTGSDRSLPVTFRWRLARFAPVLGLGIAAALIAAFRVPYGGIYYGALAGLFLMILGPRFQLWLLRRRERD